MHHLPLLNTQYRVLLIASLVLPAAVAGNAPTSDAAPDQPGKPVPEVTVEAERVKAESAAQEWLGLWDTGSYLQSWSAASPLFREHTSESHWRAEIKIRRDQLGALKSRRFLSEKFVCGTVRNSDLPEGKYAVVQFYSRFYWYRSEDVIEIVVMTKDAGGIWRVADFYVANGPPFGGYWQLPPGKPCK